MATLVRVSQLLTRFDEAQYTKTIERGMLLD